MSGAVSVLLEFKPSMLAAARAQFPRKCPNCGVQFPTLADYLEGTRWLGKPLLDEDDDEEGAVGLTCFSNCKCNSTLVVVYEDTRQHAAFNTAVRSEAARTGQPLPAVLDWITQLISEEAKLLADEESPRVPAPDPMMLAIGAAIVELVSRSTVRVPPYPGVALKLRAIVASGSGGVKEIAAAIAHDQSLTLAALRLANSSFFRRGAPVTALSVAVSRIGASELERLALATAMAEHSAGSGPLAALRRNLWHRSIATAVLARHLAGARGLSGEEAFACGLVHNVGGLVAALNLEAYLAKHPELSERPLSWWNRLINVFRAEVGKHVAGTWQLPGLLTEAICVHRRDGAAGSAHRAMLEVVLAAEAAAMLAARAARPTAGDLEALGQGLNPSEQQLLARVLPECPELIASFETPSAPPRASDGVKPMHDGVQSLSQPTARLQVLRVDSASLTFRASIALQENFLTQLSFGGSAPFTLWARTERCAAAGSEFEVTARPFGLDEATQQQWLAFAQHPPAP